MSAKQSKSSSKASKSSKSSKSSSISKRPPSAKALEYQARYKALREAGYSAKEARRLRSLGSVLQPIITTVKKQTGQSFQKTTSARHARAGASKGKAFAEYKAVYRKMSRSFERQKRAFLSRFKKQPKVGARLWDLYYSAEYEKVLEILKRKAQHGKDAVSLSEYHRISAFLKRLGANGEEFPQIYGSEPAAYQPPPSTIKKAA